MIIPLLVYATHILAIEIAALVSCSLDELACCLVEYIIHTTTESVAPFAHRKRRIHDRGGYI